MQDRILSIGNAKFEYDDVVKILVHKNNDNNTEVVVSVRDNFKCVIYTQKTIIEGKTVSQVNNAINEETICGLKSYPTEQYMFIDLDGAIDKIK